MSFLSSLFQSRNTGVGAAALYAALVAAARRPAWYVGARVPDTLDGRFDMVAAVTAFALIRLERDQDAGHAAASRLTEAFVEDMDAQLREKGVGDVVVGKHVGKMVSALGGRLAAYRDALGDDGDDDAALKAALLRNLYRGVDPGGEALRLAASGLRRLESGLASRSIDELLGGAIA